MLVMYVENYASTIYQSLNWGRDDHDIMMSKNQSAHSPVALTLSTGANSCKLINHGIKPLGQQ